AEQLYSDIQCMVKNVIFTVAKAQEMDPEGEVLMPLSGSDELEKFFGLLRMLGGHHPNLDLSEIAARCCSVLNLQDVLRRHPEWERMPVRLRIKRTRDFDHLSPRDWKGDVIAGHCDLKSCWKKGTDRATEILQRHNIVMDFGALFSKENVDLMRPTGSGQYLGVSREYDRSAVIIGNSGDEGDPSAVDATLSDGEDTSELEVEQANPSSACEPLPDDMDEPDPPGNHAHDLAIGDTGHRKHKATVVRILFEVDSGFSHDRLLRVRTQWIGGAHWDSKEGVIEGEDLEANQRFYVGGLFATLVRLRGDEVHLAIAQAVFIKRSPNNPCDFSAAPLAALTDPASTYKLGGQLLSLAPFCALSEADPTAVCSQLLWYWTSNYVALEGVKARPAPSSAMRRKQLVFSVPATLTIPLSDEARNANIADLPEECAFRMLSRQPNKISTWILNDTTLQRLREELSFRVSPDSQPSDSGLHIMIPTYGEVLSGAFPYEAHSAALSK
ncbi:hypothetical protein EV122DRAFT_226984, partial [Schizophyllum commune]